MAKQHFALASETQDVSHLPIIAFLRQQFYQGNDLETTNWDFKNKLVASSVNTRQGDLCCAPFLCFALVVNVNKLFNN